MLFGRHPTFFPMLRWRARACDAGKTIFLVTPFIDGGEMFDWVVRNAGSAAEEIVKPLFRQIVDGMRVRHAAKVGREA